MSTTATIQGSANIAGLNFGISVSRIDEGAISQTPTCNKAWAGTLSTRTNATDGVITTTAAHDVTTDDFITIYFADGIAYYANVSGIGANEITFTTALGSEGDSGDALPLATTAVIAAKEETVVVAFDGDDASMLITNGRNGARAHWQFRDVGDNVILAQEVVAGETWFWASEMNWGTPITGAAITYAYVSSADITADQIVELGVLYDSVA